MDIVSCSGKVNDFPVAPYFNLHSFNEFKKISVEADDVVMVSYPKCGTSWTHFILYGLLRMDDTGSFAISPKGDIGATSQVYPDGVRRWKSDPRTNPAEMEWSLEELLEQRRPRLFSTHSRAGNLPPSLLHRGRLLLVARNPKDALVSMKFFITKLAKHNPEMERLASRSWQEVYDDFNRIDDATDYHYGDYYTHLRDMVGLVEKLGSRATIVFYESLKADFWGEVSRLGQFLQVPMSQAKLEAIERFTSFEVMKTEGTPGNNKKPVTLRQGIVGDHQNYLTPAHWRAMDRTFEERLGHLEQLEPLRCLTVGMTDTRRPKSRL